MASTLINMSDESDFDEEYYDFGLSPVPDHWDLSKPIPVFYEGHHIPLNPPRLEHDDTFGNEIYDEGPDAPAFRVRSFMML